MLRVRMIAAICIIGPILLLIWLDDRSSYPGIWLAPLAVLASQMACAETLTLFQAKNALTSKFGAHFGALAVVLCASAPFLWKEYPSDCVLTKPGWALLGIVLAFCIVVVEEMLRYRGPGNSIARMANSMFVVFYAGALMTFMLGLRMLEGGPAESPSRKGLFAFMGAMMIVKLSDAGAYFVGRSLGRNKMAPILSPKKTWEGASGGLLVACGGAVFVFYVLGPWMSAWGDTPPTVPVVTCCLYAASLTVAGMIGDLFESLLKRDAKVKDSSTWLPGLGGVLDVLDSALAVAPVSYAWWVTGLLG
ncbi:MAG: phosphatidate cytidylyltransferase [Planctomycetales bacterium]|nr:phosphatidate cytidylyltransferase [Planctomycetales bacterium]